MASRAVRRSLAAVALFCCGVANHMALAQGLLGAAATALIAGLLLCLLLLTERKPPFALTPPGENDALIAERDRLQALVEQSPSCLIVLNPDGTLDAVNRAARRLFRTDARIADPPADLLAVLQGTPTPGFLNLALNGTERAYSVTRTEATGSCGQAVIASLVDVDGALNTIEFARMRELMQILSHEIMGTLTPIASLSRTAADMFGDLAFDFRSARDAVETVANRAEGLEQFTFAFQQLARLPAPVFVTVDLVALVSDAARLFRARFDNDGVALALVLPRDVPGIRADAAQMSAALWALLQNGAEATLARPETTSPQVRLSVAVERRAVRLTVEDNGTGIQPFHGDAIFRPFFTTKAKGSGIGLTLASQIAHAHGGGIELLAPPADHGAAIALIIPR